MKITQTQLRRIIREEIVRSIKNRVHETTEKQLTFDQEIPIWDAGYELASLHNSRGKVLDPGSVFVIANKMGIRNEDDPMFYPVVRVAEEGYRAFMASISSLADLEEG